MVKSYFSKPSWLFMLLLFGQYISAQNCWSALGNASAQFPNGSNVVALADYNGSLVVAGTFDTVGGIVANNIAAWNGTAWSALGSGITLNFSSVIGYSTQINAIAVFNGDLYVAGTFDTAGGLPVSCIAKWDGNAWSAVGAGIKIQLENDEPFAMAVYNNALYVAGRFDTAGGIAATNIAKWDGTSWSAVGTGLGIAGTNNTDDSNAVFSLAVYNNMLVAGGSFSSASGLPVNNIAAWNGTTWAALGNSVVGGVNEMALYQGNLYASLAWSDGLGAGTYYISVWNGSTWTNVLGGPGTGTNYYGYINSLLPFNGNLLAAGSFNLTANTDTFTTGIAEWNGTTWTQLVGLASAGTGYISLATYDSYLYAGGEFSQVDNTAAADIAEYTCATSGIQQISAGISVHVYPNPTNGILNISVDNFQDKGTIQIYNLLGQRLLQSNLTDDRTQINLTGQSSGTYLYHISGQNGESLSAGTFVVQ